MSAFSALFLFSFLLFLLFAVSVSSRTVSVDVEGPSDADIDVDVDVDVGREYGSPLIREQTEVKVDIQEEDYPIDPELHFLDEIDDNSTPEQIERAIRGLVHIDHPHYDHHRSHVHARPTHKHRHHVEHCDEHDRMHKYSYHAEYVPHFYRVTEDHHNIESVHCGQPDELGVSLTTLKLRRHAEPVFEDMSADEYKPLHPQHHFLPAGSILLIEADHFNCMAEHEAFHYNIHHQSFMKEPLYLRTTKSLHLKHNESDDNEHNDHPHFFVLHTRPASFRDSVVDLQFDVYTDDVYAEGFHKVAVSDRHHWKSRMVHDEHPRVLGRNKNTPEEIQARVIQSAIEHHMKQVNGYDNYYREHVLPHLMQLNESDSAAEVNAAEGQSEDDQLAQELINLVQTQKTSGKAPDGSDSESEAELNAAGDDKDDKDDKKPKPKVAMQNGHPQLPPRVSGRVDPNAKTTNPEDQLSPEDFKPSQMPHTKPMDQQQPMTQADIDAQDEMTITEKAFQEISEDRRVPYYELCFPEGKYGTCATARNCRLLQGSPTKRLPEDCMGPAIEQAKLAPDNFVCCVDVKGKTSFWDFFSGGAQIGKRSASSRFYKSPQEMARDRPGQFNGKFSNPSPAELKDNPIVARQRQEMAKAANPKAGKSNEKSAAWQKFKVGSQASWGELKQDVKSLPQQFKDSKAQSQMHYSARGPDGKIRTDLVQGAISVMKDQLTGVYMTYVSMGFNSNGRWPGAMVDNLVLWQHGPVSLTCNNCYAGLSAGMGIQGGFSIFKNKGDCKVVFKVNAMLRIVLQFNILSKFRMFAPTFSSLPPFPIPFPIPFLPGSSVDLSFQPTVFIDVTGTVGLGAGFESSNSWVLEVQHVKGKWSRVPGDLWREKYFQKYPVQPVVKGKLITFFGLGVNIALKLCQVIKFGLVVTPGVSVILTFLPISAGVQQCKLEQNAQAMMVPMVQFQIFGGLNMPKFGGWFGRVFQKLADIATGVTRMVDRISIFKRWRQKIAEFWREKIAKGWALNLPDLMWPPPPPFIKCFSIPRWSFLKKLTPATIEATIQSSLSADSLDHPQANHDMLMEVDFDPLHKSVETPLDTSFCLIPANQSIQAPAAAYFPVDFKNDLTVQILPFNSFQHLARLPTCFMDFFVGADVTPEVFYAALDMPSQTHVNRHFGTRTPVELRLAHIEFRAPKTGGYWLQTANDLLGYQFAMQANTYKQDGYKCTEHQLTELDQSNVFLGCLKPTDFVRRGQKFLLAQGEIASLLVGLVIDPTTQLIPTDLQFVVKEITSEEL